MDLGEGTLPRRALDPLVLILRSDHLVSLNSKRTSLVLRYVMTIDIVSLMMIIQHFIIMWRNIVWKRRFGKAWFVPMAS